MTTKKIYRVVEILVPFMKPFSLNDRSDPMINDLVFTSEFDNLIQVRRAVETWLIDFVDLIRDHGHLERFKNYACVYTVKESKNAPSSGEPGRKKVKFSTHTIKHVDFRGRT